MTSARLFIRNGKAGGPKKGRFPDFIIAGIEKSGTTSLFVNLSKHAEIEMTPNAVKYMKTGAINNMKEPHFFNTKWSKGVKWYCSLFNDNDKLQGEAASNYLFKEEYIKRMASTVPHARIIVALRDPVTRAYSQFNYSKELYRRSLFGMLSRLRHDKEQFIRKAKLRDVSFEEAINKEVQKGLTAGTGMIGKGLYVDLLEDLFKYYPRQQVLVIISEQMKQDMQGTYNKIFDFLGLDRARINFDRNVLVGKYEGSMNPQAREDLIRIYSPYNKRLFDLLGHRIQEWSAKDEYASFYPQR